jgi:hypothetical protein
MKLLKTITLVSVLGLLAACSSNGRVPGQTPLIIDTKGVDMNQYHADLADCEEYAQQVSVGEKAAVGAAKGAVVGGAVGAIFDGSEGARHVGGSAAVLGGARGAQEGWNEQDRVMARCMSGRGYKVLS